MNGSDNFEVFDIKKNRGETTTLMGPGEHASIVEDYSKRLAAWCTQTNDQPEA